MFHAYIPYGLGVMSRTRICQHYTSMILGKEDNSKTEVARLVFLVSDTSPQYDLVKVKFHENIQYGLGVMRRTRIFSITLQRF